MTEFDYTTLTEVSLFVNRTDVVDPVDPNNNGNSTDGNNTNINNNTNNDNQQNLTLPDLDAALRYYEIYRKMYLLAESDGPYLNGTHQQSIDNWYMYEFTKPFVLQYSYGDLSWDPELDIILIFVDLGPSMIFTQK